MASTVGDRVRELRLGKRWTQQKLAKESGLSQVTISDIERGRNRTSRDIASLAEALDTTVEFLTKGKVPSGPLREPPARYGVDTVTVDHMGPGGSMGRGVPAPDRDSVIDTLNLPAAWVRSRIPDITGLRNLRLITGYGDSMEDTYKDGDLLFVDTGINEISVDGVFVFMLEGEIFIKRVQRLPGNVLRVISDNRNRYQPYELSEHQRKDMRVLARVKGVWTWKPL